MRKSFTRLFGLLLILMISFAGFAAVVQPTLVPVIGAANQKTDVEISATFSGNVTAVATKYVRFYDANGTIGNVADDTPLFVKPATDSRIVISGKKVTFNFNDLLVQGKTYYVAYDAGAFQVGGVDQNAIAQELWNFAIGDWTAPVLDATTPFTPKNGATNLVLGSTFSVKFNENVKLGTPVSGNGTGIYLMKDNGTAYGNVVEVFPVANIAGIGTNTLVLTPSVALADNTKYYIIIENGAVVDNGSGNNNMFAGFVDQGKLFAAKTWAFSTKDATAPTVTVKAVSSTTTSFVVDVTASKAGLVWVDYVANNAAAPASITTSGKKLTFTAAGTQQVTFTSVAGTPTEGALLEKDVWVSSQTNIAVAGVTETPVNAAAVDAAAVKKADVALIDGVAPTKVGAFSPTGSGVLKDQKLSINFSEGVKIGIGNIVIKKASDNSTWKTYAIADVAKTVAVAGVNSKVEITLPDAFGSLTDYYVLIDSGAITDATGNVYAGIATNIPQSWTFTTIDYEAPTYTVDPANKASVKASVKTAITLTFNESIRHSSGNALVNGQSVNNNGLQEAFELYEDGVKIAHTYNFNAANKTITIVPTASGALKAQKTYRLIFYAYWVEDLLGNEVKSPVDITFTTQDEVAPVISAFGPATVGKSSNFTVTFSEAVRMADDSEITDTNVKNLITLKKWDAVTSSWSVLASADYTVSIDALKKVITIDPTFDLPSQASYELTVANTLEDLSGNALSVTALNPRVNVYTVGDYVAPVLTLTPANNASVIAASTNITVSASEPVVKKLGGGNMDESIIILKEGGVDGVNVVFTSADIITQNTTTLVLNATAKLKPAKTYYLSVDKAVADVSPNANVNTPVSVTFTTKSTTAPNLVAGNVFSPANGATLQPRNVAITVTFKEPVVLGAGVPTVVGSISGAVGGVSASLSTDKKVLTIAHANLNPNETYTVTLPVGTVTSESGTPQTAAISWAFDSYDTVAPTVSAYVPSLVGTPAGVAIDVTPTVVFSEEVKLLPTAYVEIRDVATDYLIQTVTGSNLTLSNSAPGTTNDQLNVKLLGNLTYGKSYYIYIAPNVISDVSGNNFFAGILNKPSDAGGVNASWDFAVAVNPGAFTIDTGKSTPKLYADNVAVDANLVVKFSRTIGSLDATKSYTVYQLAGYNSTTGVVTGPLTIADQFSAVTPSYTYSGDLFTINPVNNLVANKWYIIRFENGFLKDTYGTALSGASATGSLATVGINSSDILFNTGSGQGPIATIVPADGAKDVAKDSNITVSFNEAFFKSNGTSAITVADLEAFPSTYITVSSSSLGALPYNATISGNTITINPVSDFPVTNGEKVTVTVLANRFFDSTGKSFDVVMGDGISASPADDQVAQFDVVDKTGPIASVSVGAVATSGSTITYNVQSNEKGFVYSLVKLSSATAPTADEIKNSGVVTEIKTVNVATPTAPATLSATGLTPGSAYKVYVVGIDAATTPNTGAIASSAVINTPDDVAPVFVKSTPSATGVANDAALTFEFDENIIPGSGYVVVREKETQNIVEKWDVNTLAGTSGFSAKKLTLNLGFANGAIYGLTNWASETTYTVTLDKGTVTDAALNSNATAVVFDFTVKDWIAPTIVSTTPAVSAIAGVAPSSDGQGIKIKFSENVKPGTVVIRVYEDRGAIGGVGGYPASIIPNNEIETIDPATVVWNATNDEATFNVSHYLLKAVTKYYIEVASGSFVDDGSNLLSLAGFPGVGNAFQFQTKDQVTLAATHTYTPAAVADKNVSVNATININFGEDVIWSKHPYKPYIVSANADSIVGLFDANGVRVSNVVLTAIDTDLSGGVDAFTIAPAAGKPLADVSTYTVKFNDIQDINGNKVVDHVAAGTQFSFITGDGTAPKITFTPANKLTEISENGPFVMTFDEPLYALTGVVGSAAQVIDNNLVGNYVNLINVGTNAVIPFTATISADYKTITITPNAKIAQSGVPATVVRYGFKTAASVGDYYGNQINGGATQVLDAATVATANATTFAEVTIRDYNGPAVIAAGYAPIGATTVDATLRIQFNEDVAKGSGNLYIRELVTGNIIESISADKVTVVNNDAVLGDYITVPHAAFPLNTKFYVTIDAGFVTDISASKNKFAGISDSNSTVGKTWTFNTADIDGPVVKTYNPAPLATEVLLDSKLQLTFDKPVQPGTGNVVIYEADGTPFEIIPIGGGNVDFNSQYSAGGGDTIVSISHAKFADAMTYFVRVADGAITDKATPANNFAGILDRTWTFTTEDYTPSNYAIVSPLDNATGVSTNPTFELTFTRAIKAGTGKIQLWKRAGDVKLQEINVSDVIIAADGKSAKFSFPTSLPDGTDLYIIIAPTVFVNNSVSHVPFVGITEQWSWNFTTGIDTTAPTLVVTAPVAPIAKVFSVGLKFSEPVTGVASGITVTGANTPTYVVTGSGSQYTVTVTSVEQTNVTIVLANTITDLASTPNAFAGATLSYTTADMTAPKAIATTPTGTLTDNHPTLVVTFDENVVFGAGSLNIYKKSDNTLALSVPVTASMVSGKVATVTYTYDATKKNGLDQNTDYYVLADAGLVKDIAGNAFAGITASSTWTFKTGGFVTDNRPEVNNSLEFKVYPNPFVDYVTISNASELSKVVISNIAGQVVKEVVYPDGNIQLNELRSGVYFVTLYQDNEVVSTVKLLKR